MCLRVIEKCHVHLLKQNQAVYTLCLQTCMLIFAVIFINLAMVLYSIGVWAERIRRRLKRIHNFHRFSIFVWIILMIPMIGGMLLGANV
jgi:hypothetical protein